MSKWHSFSAFETAQSLADFCASIGLKRDEDEKHIYQNKDAIAQGEEIGKANWYRVAIENGKIDRYMDDKSTVLETQDSGNESQDSDWTLPRSTAFWIFGTTSRTRSKYSASVYKDIRL